MEGVNTDVRIKDEVKYCVLHFSKSEQSVVTPNNMTTLSNGKVKRKKQIIFIKSILPSALQEHCKEKIQMFIFGLSFGHSVVLHNLSVLVFHLSQTIHALYTLALVKTCWISHFPLNLSTGILSA